MEEMDNITEQDRAWMEDCFTYHAPTEEQRNQLANVTAGFRRAAEAILQSVPSSADRSAALRALREARMWANAAIVLEGRR